MALTKIGKEGITGIDNSSNATAITIDSSENVGIGETAPFAKLHISDTQTGRTSAGATGNLLVLEDDNNGMSILSSNSGQGHILFGDVDDGAAGAIAYDHSSDKIRFRTNSAWDRVVIDSNGNLGIGTASPRNASGFAGLTLDDASGGFVDINDSGTRVLTISGNATGNDVNTVTAIPMRFKTNNTERMRIDSSGALLIGKTSSDNTTVGGRFLADGFGSLVRDGNKCLVLNRKTSDGSIIELQQDGTEVGVIGTGNGSDVFNIEGKDNYLQIGAGDTGVRFYSSLNAIYPVNVASNSNRDNAIDLGISTVRFDDIYATNGSIQTSDQQEKNTITDSDLGIDFIKRLEPKSYIFNGKTRTHYGLIAQDVETVLSDISKPTSGFAGFIKSDISEEQDGSEYRYGLRYGEFIAPLIQAVKDQQAIIEDLQARITELENA